MKPRQREGVPVDLFPFLSVMACMMGCLMLIALSFTGGKASNVPEVLLVDSGAQHTPHLLVWDGSVLLVDREAGQVPVPWALASQNGGDNATAFGEVFKLVKANRDRHFFFIAVRPSGFGNFRTTVQKLMKDAKLGYGHWPIAQNKSLSLRVRTPKGGAGNG